MRWISTLTRRKCITFDHKKRSNDVFLLTSNATQYRNLQIAIGATVYTIKQSGETFILIQDTPSEGFVNDALVLDA